MSDVNQTAFGTPASPDAKIGIGRIFRSTYGTYRRAPLRLIGLALVPFLVSIVGVFPALFQNPDNKDPTVAIVLGIVSLILTLAQYALQIASQGGAVYAGNQLVAGSTFTIGGALRVGFRRFWPLLGLLILMGLIIVIGFFLLVIPGIIAGCVLAAAIQACILERRGPIEAMRRSAFLTRGNRWRVLGAYIVAFLPPMVAFMVIIGLGAGVAAWYKSAGPSAAVVGVGVVLALILILVSLASAGLGGPYLATLFAELREKKEGVGADGSVAGVFD